jgi:hypothetical protein
MSYLHLTVVEMRRALHRRLVRWMIVVAVIGCAATGVIAFLTSRDPVEFASAVGHPARMVDWWNGSDDSVLLTAAVCLVVGAAICGASVAGAEWRAGTITTLLTWEPSRLRLHAARISSAFGLAFVIGLLLEILFLAATLPAVLINGSTAGTDGAWWAGLALAVLRIALLSAFVAVLAASVATIGRNTSAALVALAVWALVVERLVAGLRPQLGRFMIAENVATFVPWKQIDGVEFQRPPVVAIIALIGYLAVIITAGAVTFARRDVAATA